MPRLRSPSAEGPQAPDGQRRSLTEPTSAVCDLVVLTEKEVKMANLYVFHQGFGGNGQLWYSSFDGANWREDTQVPILGISGSPSAVVYNGNLYVFHQG